MIHEHHMAVNSVWKSIIFSFWPKQRVKQKQWIGLGICDLWLGLIGTIHVDAQGPTRQNMSRTVLLSPAAIVPWRSSAKPSSSPHCELESSVFSREAGLCQAISDWITKPLKWFSDFNPPLSQWSKSGKRNYFERVNNNRMKLFVDIKSLCVSLNYGSNNTLWGIQSIQAAQITDVRTGPFQMFQGISWCFP